jgi:hypothetical protein
MPQDEFFKVVGIIIVGFFIIYMVIKLFQLQKNVVEGLTNNTDTNTNSSNSPSSGEAGTSASYASSVKAQVVKLQDELLVSKYRKDYESVLINLDDYVGYLMIQQTLNMKLNNDTKTNIENFNNLNILKNARDSLNSTMAFLDKQ